MIIGLCSHGGTGSGAFIALLKEYDNTDVLDQEEFTLTYDPDGLEDLIYHLYEKPSRFGSDVAIKRFFQFVESKKAVNSNGKLLYNQEFFKISKEFINSIIDVRYNGHWFYDFANASNVKRLLKYRVFYNLCDRYINKFRQDNVYLNDQIYLAQRKSQIYDLAKKYVLDVLVAAGADFNKSIVLDQPFSSVNPCASFCFFDKPKAIIVDRDPRDLYLEGKCRRRHVFRFQPSSHVEEFCAYYRIIRKNAELCETDKNILKVNFEDLLYHTTEMISCIEAFCDIGLHVNPGKFFHPEESIKNTRIFEKNPQYAADIKYIEENLSEYLYDFSI